MNPLSSSVTVTSTSTRLLSNLPLTLPVSRGAVSLFDFRFISRIFTCVSLIVLVSLTQAVRRTCGDGGLLTTSLAAALLQLGLSPHVITGVPIPMQLVTIL
jgi:hypothetical protein